MKKTLIKCLTYIIDRLKDKPQNISKSIFSLAPKVLTEEKDLERISPYTTRLKDAIDQKGITNIALTGVYGSGKSTILDTFRNLYSNYEYINISLASFKDNKQDKPEGTDDSERKLEISILQQIFYHVKPSRIPDSRFKRIINLTTTKLFLFSLGLIAWIFCTFMLFKFEYIENLNPSTWYPSQKLIWETFITTLIASIVFFLGIGCFFRVIIRLFINSKINKLNIKGEVELGNDIDKSVFNEHLEEIIYFFQRTEYNVVIIEDLDRFNSTDIFTKLREINILLNKSELIDREINFIYAIRDEMFIDKTERVKFFEYIIPVIPFINPSNAGEQLTKLIQESKLVGVLSKDFTEDIVTFIDDIDMRLLTNIFHEYVLYRDTLKNKKLDQNKLFATITYKNIFPDDFGKLHKNEGYLYEFISDKKKYIQPIVLSYKDKILKIKSDIEKIESEKIESVNDLRRIYLFAIFANNNQNRPILGFVINSERIPIVDIMQDTNFHNLTGLSRIKYYYGDYMGYEDILNFSFSSIESGLHKDLTYMEREKSIIDRNNKKVNELKIEVANIQDEISEIEYWSLNRIIQEIGIDEILSQKQGTIKEVIADNKKENMNPLDYPLIRNLLLNGHIDENYNDYISIFHGINMTSQDFEFIQKIKSGAKENYSYTLTNIDQIIKKLPTKYFKNEAILNFDLFDYLLQNYVLYEVQYKSIIELIKKKIEHALRFMDEYISSKRKYIPFFVEELSENWDDFWDYIYEHPTYDDQKKDNYLILILRHAKLNSIYSLNKSLHLANYIETHEKFISLFTDKERLDKVTSIIDKLNIYFEELELPNGENNELFKYIYDNDHYSINIHNITLLLNKLCEGQSEGIACWNYTTILNSDCEPLKRYIQEFLLDYIEKVFLKLPYNTNESEDTLLRLLNNDNLEDELKIKILQKQETKIKVIRDIESLSIQYEIFRNNKVDATWYNIINYYYKSEEDIINGALIEFLNIEENYQQLNEEGFTYKAVDTAKFRENLLKANDLTIEAYTELLIKTSNNWNILDFSHLDQNKVEWLIDNKLNLTKSNLDILKSHFSAISIKLIEKKRHELITKYSELELDINDHIKILQSSVITQSIKEEIIGKIANEWIIENDQLKLLIQNILYQSSKHILEYEALDAIVEYSSNNDKRLQLIYNHMGGLDNDQVQTLITKLGGKYKEIFELKKQKTFDYTPTKANLFEELESRKMVNSKKINIDKKEIKVVALYK